MLNGALESFGTERILSEVAKVTGEATAVVVNAIVLAARVFANGAAQFDDMTVLAVRRLR
jgi:serine phosphatase RsbU (regulator of sigma subunit)